MSVARTLVLLLFLTATVSALAPEPASAAHSHSHSHSHSRADAILEPLLSPLERAYHQLLATSETARHLDRFATRFEGVLALGTTAALLALLGLAIRQLRPRGSVRLRLRFPDALDGDFEVTLETRRQPSRKRQTRVLAHGSHVRRHVGRETQFDRIRPGPVRLEIRGRLRALESGALLAKIETVLALEIVAHETTILDHALPDVDTPVEIRVQWDRLPARHVGLRSCDASESVRYAHQGVFKRALPRGRHAITIGASDRVVEQTIEVEGFEPNRFQIDLASPEGLVFKGCPPAVPAFLQGDFATAAAALERDGQATTAALLRARLHRSRGEIARAAAELERADRTREAAELRREMADFEHAARLFERAGDLPEAAAMFDAAEVWPEAARVYAGIEAWAEAARCYARAGDVAGQIDALEGQAEWLRAAALASESGDRARSIRLLQRIDPMDPEFGRAGELLALAYEQEGHLDLAAHQLERCLAALPPGEYAPELELHLCELFDESDEPARALAVLEALRDRDPTYPGVAARIEALRKKLTGPLREATSEIGEPPSDATELVAQTRYEIQGEIGRGGMGHVFKARDRRLDRIVALKRMPENLRDHPAAVGLFLGEAQAAARMNHPNIVTLYDADQERGRFFITMELLEGLPLSTILRDRGRFTPFDTARLGLQICAGLQFAHDHAIVHRDIKTANLFLTRDRVLKIMDFGLAKILQAVRDGHTSVIAGSPYYMAPEQAAGCVVDGRTDLYGLGVTLFELSTGQLPFSEGDVADQHRRAPRPDPAAGRPDYPHSLADLIRRLMAIDPADRPAQARDVAGVLATISPGPREREAAARRPDRPPVRAGHPPSPGA